MGILLYDLCARDERRRFSPHCWKARMALAHKGLPFATKPTPFTRIAEIGDGFSKTVPVIDDGGTLVPEFLDIALYLEDRYPEAPSLFKGAGGRAESRLIETWALTAIHPPLLRLIVKDIHDQLDEPDRAYFRDSREQRLGATLEDIQAGRDGRLDAFREALAPLRLMLRKQPFIGGDGPLFADYVVFGPLQWARVASSFRILADDDPVADWFGRCLDLYDGLGRSMPAAA